VKECKYLPHNITKTRMHTTSTAVNTHAYYIHRSEHTCILYPLQ